MGPLTTRALPRSLSLLLALAHISLSCLALSLTMATVHTLKRKRTKLNVVPPEYDAYMDFLLWRPNEEVLWQQRPSRFAVAKRNLAFLTLTATIFVLVPVMSLSYSALLYLDDIRFAWWPLCGLTLSFALLPVWLMHMREMDQCYFLTTRRLVVMRRSRLCWVPELRTDIVELSKLHDTSGITLTRFNDGSGSLSCKGIAFHHATSCETLENALRRAVQGLDCRVDDRHSPILVWFLRLMVGVMSVVIVCVMLPLLCVIGLRLAQEYMHHEHPEDPSNDRPWYIPHSYFYITVSTVFVSCMAAVLAIIMRATWYVIHTSSSPITHHHHHHHHHHSVLFCSLPTRRELLTLSE